MYPVNSLEFRKGYKLGVEKGRTIERRMALFLTLGFVVVFEIIHRIITRLLGC